MSELPMVGDEFAGFRLRSVLGRGGMSVVYEAENPRLGSVIALKVLAPELAADDAFRARFLAESRIAASLNHPNVIPVYDMGSCAGLLYIAMRYVSGTDLREVLKKRSRISPAAAVFQLGQAARALDAAHRKGLVHRDVKPGNLLIERGGDDDPDHVYLADFGITKHVMSRSGLTSTGQFLGTINYVAPEQIRGTPVTGLADQYSLGCVLYECLTGRVPFDKDLDAAIIWAHVEEMPPLPATLRPELPPEVDEVFSRVLAKRPADRYRDCREFVEAARACLGGLAAEPQAGPSLASLAGPQPGRQDQGDTITSHGRPVGRPCPGETGNGRQFPASPRPAGTAAAQVAPVSLARGPGGPDPGRRGGGHLGPGQRRSGVPCGPRHGHAVIAGPPEGAGQCADDRAAADEQIRGCGRPAAALKLPPAKHGHGHLHGPGHRYHRSRLPDLSVAERPVRRVPRENQGAELRSLPAELPRLQRAETRGRDQLEPQLPAPRNVFSRAIDLRATRPG